MGRRATNLTRALLSRERAAAGGGSVKGGVKRGTSGTEAKRTLDGVPCCVKSITWRARGSCEAEMVVSLSLIMELWILEVFRLHFHLFGLLTIAPTKMPLKALKISFGVELSKIQFSFFNTRFSLL